MGDTQEIQKLGAAIREYRLAQRISQDNFADKIDMHRAYYGAIERGNQNITIATLLRICKGLGTTPSKVLDTAGL